MVGDEENGEEIASHSFYCYLTRRLPYLGTGLLQRPLGPVVLAKQTCERYLSSITHCPMD